MNLSNTLIGSVMDSTPVTISNTASIKQAMTQLNEANLESAAVVDASNQLVGFFSSHDVLVELWCQDYNDLSDITVESVMKKDVQTVNPSDSLLHLAEYMSIDHDKLHPVTSMGIATSLSTKSTADRAREMQVNRPHQYPVVKDDKLVGMISRRHVMQAISALLFNSEETDKAEVSTVQKIA